MYHAPGAPDIRKIYACVFQPVKSTMPISTCFSSKIHLSSWWSLSICDDERKRSSRWTER